MCLLVLFSLQSVHQRNGFFSSFWWENTRDLLTRQQQQMQCGVVWIIHFAWGKKQWQLLISSGLLHSQIRCAKDASLPWDQKNRVRTHMQTHPGFLAISSLISFSAGKSSAVTRIAHSSKRFVLYWTELVHTAGLYSVTWTSISAFHIALEVNVLNHSSKSDKYFFSFLIAFQHERKKSLSPSELGISLTSRCLSE